MPQTRTDWLTRYNSELARTFNPTFQALDACSDDLIETAGGLRRAFAFLRRHGDRRYSASSLMRLLALADRCDGAAASGRALAGDDCPKVIHVEVPFAFDEETEVKTGGTVAMAVVLPDGRTMMAVHQQQRRKKLGAAMLGFITSYCHGAPTLWIHGANRTGQMFALAQGWQPWEMNSAGALLFCNTVPQDDPGDAVEYCDDSAIEQAMRMQRQPERGPRTRRNPFASTSDGLDIRPLSARDLWADPAPLVIEWPDEAPIIEDDDEWYDEADVGTCSDPDCTEPQCRRRRERQAARQLQQLTQLNTASIRYVPSTGATSSG